VQRGDSQNAGFELRHRAREGIAQARYELEQCAASIRTF
jgi:hypothetical protein